MEQIAIEAAAAVVAAACLWALGKLPSLVRRTRAVVAGRRARSQPVDPASTNARVLVAHLGSFSSSDDAWGGVHATGYGAVRAREAQTRGITPAAYARSGMRREPAQELPPERVRPTQGAIVRRLLRGPFRPAAGAILRRLLRRAG